MLKSITRILNTLESMSLDATNKIKLQCLPNLFSPQMVIMGSLYSLYF